MFTLLGINTSITAWKRGTRNLRGEDVRGKVNRQTAMLKNLKDILCNSKCEIELFDFLTKAASK